MKNLVFPVVLYVAKITDGIGEKDIACLAF